MVNIIDTDTSELGVPIHNPPYKSKELWCRFDLVKLEVTVAQPGVIADLVPRPLEYVGQKIYISANKVREFKGSFAWYASDMRWNEILVQIPCMYGRTHYYYSSEMFVDNFAIVSADREIYGFPKIPAKVLIKKTGMEFAASASYYGGEKKICNLTFKPLRAGTIVDLGVRPRIINFKHIPSPVENMPAEVKALVALKYLKQKVHEIVVGEGTFELCEFAPQYLISAHMGGVEKAIYMDLELHVNGGRIVYDYNRPENQAIHRREE